jgi:hypothetical protein
MPYVLTEAIHGEESSLAVYNAADVSILPRAIQAAIAEQRQAIANAKQRLEDLRQVYSD